MYLVVCEVSHQSDLNVGVVGNTTQDLGTLEGRLWVGGAVVQIPARETLNLAYQPSKGYNYM